MKGQGLAFVLVVGLILALVALLVLLAYLIKTDDGVLEQSKRKETIEYYINVPTSISFGALSLF